MPMFIFFKFMDIPSDKGKKLSISQSSYSNVVECKTIYLLQLKYTIVEH